MTPGTDVVYGVCAGSGPRLGSTLLPSLEEHARSSLLLVRTSQTSIAEAYNDIIDESLDLDLEFLVLLHDDVELTADPLPALRAARAEHPSAGVIGAVGGRGFRGSRWWLSSDLRGTLTDGQTTHDYSSGSHEVDAVDGLLLAFPASALPYVRFDEGYGGFHLYDADICRELKAIGRSVVVTDLPLVHHSKAGFGHAARFYRAEARYLRKWKAHRGLHGAVDLANAGLRIVWCTVRRRLGGRA